MPKCRPQNRIPNPLRVSAVADLLNSLQRANSGTIISLPGGQKVSPDVESLIGPLEEAEDAVCRRAPGVPVPRNDAILMENLKKKNTQKVQSFMINLTNQVLHFWK